MKLITLTLGIGLIASVAQAQNNYAYDRVYTGNQISNTVSVIDPSTNKLLGEINLGKPAPNILSALYKGQVLVHGLRYSPKNKMLAAVSIGSNAVTLISTTTNKILKTIYIGRSPHEPTFTPDGKQVWVTVRGEAYLSVIDIDKMLEVKRVPVADGPGMIAFSPDGKLAYVCSSFTPVVEVINTVTYKIVKKIPVISPFSPNIFTSPKGEWIALTHKDVGKVTLINAKLSVVKVINTGAVTNHVTFTVLKDKLLMLVTIGGENNVKIYDVAADFKLINTITVGALPHGIWISPDGKMAYVGLEFADKVDCIDLTKMKVVNSIQIGQSPQALVYANNAVLKPGDQQNLKGLNDTTLTQVIALNSTDETFKGKGRLAVRSIGLTDFVEQAFNSLTPNTAYIFALSKSSAVPFSVDYQINTFTTDDNGKYMGQSTGLINKVDGLEHQTYNAVILVDVKTKKIVMTNSIE